jgi:hypothetical protein
MGAIWALWRQVGCAFSGEQQRRMKFSVTLSGWRNILNFESADSGVAETASLYCSRENRPLGLIREKRISICEMDE